MQGAARDWGGTVLPLVCKEQVMKEEAVIKQSWPMSRLKQFTLSWMLSRVIDFVKSVAFPLTGFCILLVIWSLISGLSGGSLPGPARTLRVFGQLVSHPFYDNG